MTVEHQHCRKKCNTHPNEITYRTFICIKIPDECKAIIKDWIHENDRHYTGVKWIDDSQYHITLKFCGEQNQTTVKKISSYLRNLHLKEKPVIKVKNIGGFPNSRAARVIKADINGDNGMLERLASEIDIITSSVGIPKEHRHFSPHLTLARTKEIANVKNFVENKLSLETPSWKVNEIYYMQSILTPEGPKYKQIGLFKI